MRTLLLVIIYIFQRFVLNSIFFFLFECNFFNLIYLRVLHIMFRRKLRALDYPLAETFNFGDQADFRNLILWMEDRKIRHCTVEQRDKLRDVRGSNWMNLYKVYIKEVTGIPHEMKREEDLEFLIAVAMKSDYTEQAKDFRTIVTKNVKDLNTTPKIVSTNNLDSLDFQNPDFIKGVNTLAGLLNINQHPDHLKTFNAVSKIILSKLHKEALADPNSFVVKGVPFPYQDTDSGFKVDDDILSEAAKILRLMYIQNLRDLQTQINECIAVSQTFTANPKTDTKLGQVGR